MYDIFLSHSSKDKALVEDLAIELKKGSIEPFLDSWHLVPGEPWQEALEVALDNSKTIGVCLGPAGLGPWELEESRAALEKRVGGKNLRVIPIILPGVSSNDLDSIPQFFRRYTRVDISNYKTDAKQLINLLAGINGVTPSEQTRMSNCEGNYMRILVIFAGPSSVGKDVVLGRIFYKAQKSGYRCEVLNKFTTREPRNVEGINNPFIFLSQKEFKLKQDNEQIGAYVYSYGYHYGVDLDHITSISPKKIVFTSLRTRNEAIELEEFAKSNGYDVVKIFLNSDIESLKNRTLLRTMAGEEKQQRTEQILEDICVINSELDDYKKSFCLFLENGDDIAINTVSNSAWELLENRISAVIINE